MSNISFSIFGGKNKYVSVAENVLPAICKINLRVNKSHLFFSLGGPGT